MTWVAGSVAFPRVDSAGLRHGAQALATDAQRVAEVAHQLIEVVRATAAPWPDRNGDAFRDRMNERARRVAQLSLTLSKASRIVTQMADSVDNVSNNYQGYARREHWAREDLPARRAQLDAALYFQRGQASLLAQAQALFAYELDNLRRMYAAGRLGGLLREEWTRAWRIGDYFFEDLAEFIDGGPPPPPPVLAGAPQPTTPNGDIAEQMEALLRAGGSIRTGVFNIDLGVELGVQGRQFAETGHVAITLTGEAMLGISAGHDAVVEGFVEGTVNRQRTYLFTNRDEAMEFVRGLQQATVPTLGEYVHLLDPRPGRGVAHDAINDARNYLAHFDEPGGNLVSDSIGGGLAVGARTNLPFVDGEASIGGTISRDLLHGTTTYTVGGELQGSASFGGSVAGQSQVAARYVYDRDGLLVGVELANTRQVLGGGELGNSRFRDLQGLLDPAAAGGSTVDVSMLAGRRFERELIVEVTADNRQAIEALLRQHGRASLDHGPLAEVLRPYGQLRDQAFNSVQGRVEIDAVIAELEASLRRDQAIRSTPPPTVDPSRRVLVPTPGG